MKCNYCGTDNSTDAVFCRGCGRPLHSNRENQKKVKFRLIKKGIKIIFWLFIIATTIAAIWYFSLPDLKIAPETSKVEFDSDGGTIEIPIITDADYSQWHVSGPSYVDITKKTSSIIIKCNKNEEKYGHSRSGRISLYCDGRNTDRVYIEIEQEESDMYVYGEIKDVFLKHNVYAYSSEYDEEKKGLKIIVRCNVRHNNGNEMRCALWFHHENEDEYINEDSPYTTSDNQLTVQEVFYPSDNSDEDIELFIPYSEFSESEKGIYFSVGIFEYRTDPTGKQIVSKDFKDKSFNINK